MLVWVRTSLLILVTLRILGMSWGVKNTCFEAPGVSLGGSGVSIGGVGILSVIIFVANDCGISFSTLLVSTLQ